MKKHVKYETKRFSPKRQILSDFNDEAASRHHVLGLLEIDVTDARRIIKEYEEREGLKLSFTGWIAKVIGDAVNENKRLNSFLKGRTKIIVFENVDISIMIEIKNEKGQNIPYNYIIRKVETKSVREITEEIRSVQNKKLSEKDQFRRKSSIGIKIYRFIPLFIRRMILQRLLKN
ncbi:MAG: 2-oxo acid dehydrogenase subunit E2, partial [Candidatus Heimdallarchaeaceae archaeon]